MFWKKKKYLNPESLRTQSFEYNRIIAENTYVGLYHPCNMLIFGNEMDIEKYILANILQCNSSYVVTLRDPSVYHRTKSLLAKEGYKVEALNLRDMNDSNCYNPLIYAQTDEELMHMVQLLCQNGYPENINHDDVDALLWLMLHYTQQLPPAERTLKTANELFRRFDFDREDVLDSFSELFTVEGAFASKCAAKVCSVPAKQLKGVIVAAAVVMAIWGLSQINALTSKNEMDLLTIGTHKRALFILLPYLDTSFDGLANVLSYQLLNILSRQQCAQHVMVITDTVVPGMQELLHQASARNLDISLCVHSIRPKHTDWKSVAADFENVVYYSGDTAGLAYCAQQAGVRELFFVKVPKWRAGRYCETPKCCNMTPDQCLVILHKCLPYVDEKYNIEKHPRYQDSCV